MTHVSQHRTLQMKTKTVILWQPVFYREKIQNIEILPMVSPSMGVKEKAMLSETPGRLIIASDQQPELCSISQRSLVTHD